MYRYSNYILYLVRYYLYKIGDENNEGKKDNIDRCKVYMF